MGFPATRHMHMCTQTVSKKQNTSSSGALYLQFCTGRPQYVSPATTIEVHRIERAVLVSAGVVAWNASFVVRVSHVDLVVGYSDAVWIVETCLDNSRTGAVKTRPHYTRCLAPVSVIQIPVTQTLRRRCASYFIKSTLYHIVTSCFVCIYCMATFLLPTSFVDKSLIL